MFVLSVNCCLNNGVCLDWKIRFLFWMCGFLFGLGWFVVVFFVVGVLLVWVISVVDGVCLFVCVVVNCVGCLVVWLFGVLMLWLCMCISFKLDICFFSVWMIFCWCLIVCDSCVKCVLNELLFDCVCVKVELGSSV